MNIYTPGDTHLSFAIQGEPAGVVKAFYGRLEEIKRGEFLTTDDTDFHR
jgi:hypothetical protein